MRRSGVFPAGGAVRKTLAFQQPSSAIRNLGFRKVFGNQLSQQTKIDIQNNLGIGHQCGAANGSLKKSELGYKRKSHSVPRPFFPLINKLDCAQVEAGKNLSERPIHGGFGILLGIAMRYDQTHLENVVPTLIIAA
jgi:hypothetical protein